MKKPASVKLAKFFICDCFYDAIRLQKEYKKVRKKLMILCREKHAVKYLHNFEQFKS